MKKIIYPTIFSFFLLTTLAAQPVITSNDLFLTGSEFIINEVEDVKFDAGPAGPDQIWDFSAAVPDTTLQFTNRLVPAADVPLSSAFPEANYVWESTNDSMAYSFLKITDSEVEFLGFGNEDIYFVYDNPETNLVFPFTYQDQFTDTYRSEIEEEGASIITYGMLESTADAYGTIITPDGTYENVLRVKTESTDYDTLSAQGMTFSTISSATDYTWFSPSEHFLVANYFIERDTSFGIPSELAGFCYYTPTGTVSSRAFQDKNWEISSLYQDGEGLNLSVKSGTQFIADLAVYDMQGRAIEQLTVRIRPGENRFQIPFNQTPGPYVLHLSDGQKEVKNQKFIFN